MLEFSLYTKEQKNERDLDWFKVLIFCVIVPLSLATLGLFMCTILCCWTKSIRKRLELRDLKSGTGENNAVKITGLLELSTLESAK